MTLDDAIATLRAEAELARDAQAPLAPQTDANREVLGLRVLRITELATAWRQDMTIQERVDLADGLWNSKILEAQIAATKLLVQARIADDEAVWQLIASWVPQLEDDQMTAFVCDAAARRLIAKPARLAQVEPWLQAPVVHQRCAAIIMTRPWALMNNPKPVDLEIRERLMVWAGILAKDPNARVIKSLGYWLKDLVKHDPERVQKFLMGAGAKVKGFGFMSVAREKAAAPKVKLPAAVEPLTRKRAEPVADEATAEEDAAADAAFEAYSEREADAWFEPEAADESDDAAEFDHESDEDFDGEPESDLESEDESGDVSGDVSDAEAETKPGNRAE